MWACADQWDEILIFGESRKTLVEINLSLKFYILELILNLKMLKANQIIPKYNTLLAKENRSICQICSSIWSVLRTFFIFLDPHSIHYLYNTSLIRVCFFLVFLCVHLIFHNWIGYYRICSSLCLINIFPLQ